jgi:hypothetical protein
MLEAPPPDAAACDVEETVCAQATVVVGVVGVSFLLKAATRIPTARSMEHISFMTDGRSNSNATDPRGAGSLVT